VRRLEYYPVEGINSMRLWTKVASPWRVAWNFLIIETCRIIPFLELKNWLLRHLVGVKIGSGASVGVMAMFDLFRPQWITLGDDVILGYNCTILCHEFLPREYRLGKVEIGRGVLVGANATILAGVSIGEGAIVAAGAVVNRDVPPYTLAAGVPARVVKQLEKGGKNRDDRLVKENPLG